MRCRVFRYYLLISDLLPFTNSVFQVIVTADLTKSPPVIKVYSVNPYASEK